MKKYKNTTFYTGFNRALLNSASGFTLIEILVVIAIIGLLASVALVGMNSARIKARNSQRKGNIAQIRQALDMYYHDTNNGLYPHNGTVGNPNTETTDLQGLASFLVPKYMSEIPKDPKNNLKDFEYVWANGGQDYGLLVPFSNDDGTDCKWITPGGNDNWFKVGPNKVDNCNY